ncbi:MAG: hypothetical protein IPH11_00825 [Ignavibacteriales bacterium]|nr:hypothetical protein [Ignavibacteriales bacterium]
MNEYFIFKYVPENNTLLSNVYRLQPGNYITLDLKSFELIIKSYWQLKKKSEYSKMHYEDAKDLLSDLTGKAIRAQLMSDVPLGTFFSGGLDSSIIVYHLKDHTDIIHYAARKSKEDLKNEVPHPIIIMQKNLQRNIH